MTQTDIHVAARLWASGNHSTLSIAQLLNLPESDVYNAIEQIKAARRRWLP